MNRGLLAQVLALVVIVGFLCFAGGYALAGGLTGHVESLTYGENIQVQVKIESLGINKTVTLYKGMTAFDALSKVASIRTEYYESFGASIVTEIGGLQQGWVYRVNGVEPLVAMSDYQLRDGDILEFVKSSF